MLLEACSDGVSVIGLERCHVICGGYRCFATGGGSCLRGGK